MSGNRVGKCESGGCVYVNAETGSDNILVGSTVTAMSMFVTPAEFVKFREEIQSGLYDHIASDALGFDLELIERTDHERMA